MKKKFSLCLSLLFLLVMLLAGCQSSGSTSKNQPDVLRVSYSYQPLNAPTIVAHEKKIFEEAFAKEGITVAWLELEGPALTEALTAGSIDIALSLNYVTAIIAKGTGSDIEVLASYNRFPEAIGLIAAPGSDVESVAGLAGKTVALPRGTMLQELLLRAMAKENIPASEVEIAGMVSVDAETALLQNQVDAAIVLDPLLEQVMGKGGRLLTTGEGLILGQSLIAARTDFINQYPAVIKQFLNLQKQTVDWVRTNDEETKNIISKVSQMDIRAVVTLYPKLDFSLAIDQANVEALRETAVFLQENGFLQKDIDTSKLIDDLLRLDFLQ